MTYFFIKINLWNKLGTRVPLNENNFYNSETFLSFLFLHVFCCVSAAGRKQTRVKNPLTLCPAGNEI